MAESTTPIVHPWIADLRLRLDSLERALFAGDAPSIETASSQVQAILQQAPKTADFAQPNSALHADMLQAAHRFGQLRQTVLRASAKNQRAIKSLMPQQVPSTYGRGMGSPAGGAGQAYLSA